MANILFIVRKLEGGGAERQLIVLARELVQYGHNVTILVWVAGGPYERDLKGTGIRYVVLDKRGLLDHGGFLLRAHAFIRRLRPDVIHGYLDTGNFVAAMMRRSIPNSRIIWGVRDSGVELRHYDLHGRILFHINRIVSRLADVIISNSHAGANHVIAQGYPADRIRVIPNGIDIERFQPYPVQATEIRTKWGISNTDKVIGIAARLDPMKDYETFVEAAKLLAARRLDVKFVCVGEGIEPYRSNTLAALDGAGLGNRLRWEGFLSDIPAFYSAINIATSSSRSEGFSNSIAEAMACGTPCVVTDVGDSRLIVGETGIVIPPRNPLALADAWEKLLYRISPELSSACRTRIIINFSVTKLIATTEDTILPPGLPRLVGDYL